MSRGRTNFHAALFSPIFPLAVSARVRELMYDPLKTSNVKQIKYRLRGRGEEGVKNGGRTRRVLLYR